MIAEQVTTKNEPHRKVKVFYFIPNLQQGGSERQILQLIRHLPERFEPVLCLYNDTIFYEELLLPGQPRYVLGRKKMDLGGLKRLTEIIKDERPDIVHSYRDKSNFWARIAALRANTPVIISSCRNRMIEPRYLLVERLLSDRCQKVITNSEGVRYELIKWARVDPKKIEVIYNVLDVGHFRPPTSAQRVAARQRWQLGKDQPALLLPGRIGLQKNHVVLLAGLDRLLAQRRVPDNTQLLLPGRARDALTSRLVSYLTNRGRLSRHVRLLGSQQDMRSLYWASDVLVMPSLWEGLSNAVLEGCASGLPAIVSHAANVDQIVEHLRTGIEVPTHSWSTLIGACEEMLSFSDEKRRAMGQEAARHVRQRFAHALHLPVDRTVALYDELLASARGMQ